MNQSRNVTMLPHPPLWAATICTRFSGRRDLSGGPLPVPGPAEIARIAELTSPATAAALFGSENGVEWPASLTLAGVETARKLNGFRRRLGEQWVHRIAGAGFDVMVIKGGASAHMLYHQPEDRGLSDLDILIRPQDLTGISRFLLSHGCRFADVPTRSPWGFVSDASFQPLITPDGAGNIDLHIHPDAWPLHRALSSADLFDRSRRTETGIRLPHPDDHLLIMASHAARDLFSGNAMKGIVDGLILFSRPDITIDVQRVRDIARRAWCGRPIDNFLHILQALGAGPIPGLPPVENPPGLLVSTAQMVADLFPDGTDLPFGTKLVREFGLAAKPPVTLYRLGKRALGLIKPASGVPKAD